MSLSSLTPPPPPPPPRSSLPLPPPPPAPVFAQPPRPPRPPLSRKTKLIIGSVLGALALVWGVVFYLGSWPGSSLFTTALNQDNWGKNWDSKEIKITQKTGSASSLSYHATVTGSLREALYVTENAGSWLQANAGMDLAQVRSACLAINQPQWSQVAPFVKAPAPGMDINKVQILKKVADAETSKTFDVSFSARKGSDGWSVSINSITSNGGELGGAPLGSYAAGSVDSGNPTDLARIKDVAAKAVEFANAYKIGLAAYKADLAAKMAERTKDLRAAIAPGSLFAGEGTRGNQAPVRLFLEFVAPKGGGETRVAALLREDTGWQEARPFTGAWKYDDATGSFSVQLNTSGDSAIRNLSPFLSSAENWGVNFAFDGGVLTGRSADFTYRFERRTSEQAAADRAEVEKPLHEMLDTLAVGSVFRGVGTSKDKTKSFDLLMRITRNDRNGAVVGATFSAPDRPGVRREARGLIVSNSHLNEGNPLRLQMLEERRAQNDWGWFGRNDFSTLGWHLDGKNLVGESGSYTYELSRLSSEEADAFVKNQEQKRTRNLAICRPGASYTGVVTTHGGNHSYKARLLFTRMERAGSLIECTVTSMADPTAQVTLNGSLDVDEGALHLSRKSVRETKRDPSFTDALNGDFGDGLHIAEGELVTEWNYWGYNRAMHFALDPKVDYSATAAPETSEGAPTAAVSSAAAVAPEATAALGESAKYPSANGAYLFVDGRWVPLPRNDAKYVMNLMGQLDLRIGARMGDFKFSGATPLPQAAGAITIFCRGAWSQTEGSDYPIAELAPTTTAADGIRKVSLYRVAPGYAGFHNSRVPGEVEQLTSNTLVYRTSDLPPGNYAMSVGQDMFEVAVH